MAPALPNLPLRLMSGLSYPSALSLFACLHAPECRAHMRRGREKTRTCVDGASHDASPGAPLATPALAAPSPNHTRSVINRSAHNEPSAFGPRGAHAPRRFLLHRSTRAPCCVHATLWLMHMPCRCCMTPTMPATRLQRALDMTAHSADMRTQEARGRSKEPRAVCANACKPCARVNVTRRMPS